MSKERHVVATEAAPAAIGPYSQAVRAGDFLFASGQIALDPATMELVGGDVAVQTERVLENLRAVLEAAGATLAHVVRATVYLADMNDFERMNTVYRRYFGENPPARVAIEVSRLPKDARVEVDVVAYLG